MFYRQYRLPGAQDADGTRTATGIEVGLGTRVSSTQANFKQGSFQTTNNPLDLAIEGDGFFRVQNPNGDFYYTRAGNFNLNANGQIVLGSANNGYMLDPGLTVPQEATGIVVSTDGQVQYSTSNSNDAHNARANSTGKIRESGRVAEARRQLVSEDGRIGRRADRTPRAKTASAIFGKGIWKHRTWSQ